MFYQPERFATGGLPPASEFPAGTHVWNTDDNAPNWSDGTAWHSGVGGPAIHGATHATGGTDALTVNGTTATNNPSTTGATINSGVAVVGVTDPGHIHSLTDPGHVHTVNATTAVNNASVMPAWYFIENSEVAGAVMGAIAQNVAGPVAPTAQAGIPRPMNVTFPVGWVGGTVTIEGIGRVGQVISETFVNPGGGGTVVGQVPFVTLSNFTNSAPAGGAGTSATIVTRDAYAVPHDNVVAFLKVSIDGTIDSFNISDTVNGVFEPSGNHHGNHGIEVWYTYSHTVTQAAHSHTASTATTGASVASHATGVVVTDSGHSHGVTDPGHVHTQNGHTHTLS